MLGCFSDEHITRDSCKGKVQGLPGKNVLFPPRNIKVIRIDTDQPPRMRKWFLKSAPTSLYTRNDSAVQVPGFSALADTYNEETERRWECKVLGGSEGTACCPSVSPFPPFGYRPLIPIRAAGRCPFWDVSGWARCLRRGCNSPFSSGARAGATSGCTFTGDDFSHHYSHPVLHRLIKTSI